MYWFLLKDVLLICEENTGVGEGGGEGKEVMKPYHILMEVSISRVLSSQVRGRREYGHYHYLYQLMLTSISISTNTNTNNNR